MRTKKENSVYISNDYSVIEGEQSAPGEVGRQGYSEERNIKGLKIGDS